MSFNSTDESGCTCKDPIYESNRTVQSFTGDSY